MRVQYHLALLYDNGEICIQRAIFTMWENNLQRAVMGKFCRWCTVSVLIYKQKRSRFVLIMANTVCQEWASTSNALSLLTSLSVSPNKLKILAA